MKSSEKGLFMVFTGDGKGKTTAAFGQALRALGHGKSVCVIQFMKGLESGEVRAVKNYLPRFAVYRFGSRSLVLRDHPLPSDIEAARQGLKMAQEFIGLQKYDMVILDEINVALDYGLIVLTDVVNLIRMRPAGMTLIFTGRNAHPDIVALADTVSEVRAVKHHAAGGMKSRPGIEY